MGAEDAGSDCVERVVRWLGIPWTEQQSEQLGRYTSWLVDEGIAIGGIGPSEKARLWERHICDSLVFGRWLKASSHVLDVGTGIGLPGIPLAIAFPEVRHTLLDRSGRRIDALRRVRRLVDASFNVVHQEVEAWDDSVDGLVFRASLRMEQAMRTAERLLSSGGVAVFGLGRGESAPALMRWRSTPYEINDRIAIDEKGVPKTVLDGGAWLLRIVAK